MGLSFFVGEIMKEWFFVFPLYDNYPAVGYAYDFPVGEVIVFCFDAEDCFVPLDEAGVFFGELW